MTPGEHPRQGAPAKGNQRQRRFSVGVAGAAIAFALLGGCSSGDDSASSEPTDAVAGSGSSSQPERSETGETRILAAAEFLATPEKSPEEAVIASMKLEYLVETTLTEDVLLPYLYYDTNEATNPKLQTHMNVIREVARLRAAVGPVGSYVDEGETKVTILESSKDRIVSENEEVITLVDWDHNTRQFIAHTQKYTTRTERRPKTVGNTTLWTLYSHQATAPSETLATRVVSREEANKMLEESFEDAKAVFKQLGLKF